MDLFTRLFGDLLAFVYHCFDRIVIHGYLTGLSRPEHVVHFFREVGGAPVISKEILSERTHRYQSWVEAFARNHGIPIEWAEKGVRKEDEFALDVLPHPEAAPLGSRRIALFDPKGETAALLKGLHVALEPV